MPILQDTSFQTKLLLLYSLTITTIVLVSLSIFYLFISHEIEERNIENMRQIAQRTSEQIHLFLRDLDQLALQVVLNPNIKTTFQELKKQPRTGNYFATQRDAGFQIIDILSSINGPNLSAARISLYNEFGDYISLAITPDDAETVASFLESSRFSALLEQVRRQDGGRYILPKHIDFWSSKRKEPMLSLFREIKDLYHAYGFVEIQAPYAKLAKICRFPDAPNMRVYLIDQDGETIYPTKLSGLSEEPAEAYLAQIAVNEGDHGAFKRRNNAHDVELVTYHLSPFSQWSFIIVQEQKELLTPIYVTLRFAVLLGVAIISLSLFLVYFLTSRITKPLIQLKDSLSVVSFDNPTIAIDDLHTHNELIHIESAFNHMLQRLKFSMEQNVALRSQEMKAHILALQSQMNPHFLNNMLATIGSAAQQAGAEDVMEMSHILGKMLRYVTSYDTEGIRMRDEVEHTGDYLKLMKQRYEDRFHYSIECDDIVLDAEVPKLILQPLVENCFAHAFTQVRPPWEIHVNISQEKSHWYLQVSDNGSGFDEGVLAEISERVERFTQQPSVQIQELKSGGLGLFNSIIRLQYRYGSAMGFKVMKNSEQGTIVRLRGAMP